MPSWSRAEETAGTVLDERAMMPLMFLLALRRDLIFSSAVPRSLPA